MAISVILLLLAGRAADAPLQRFSVAEGHMGTHCRITLYAKDEAEASRACKATFARIADLDRIMSDYRSTSELMQLCQKSGGPPVKVSKDLFQVLSRAQEVSRLSHGAFDVTVGPVVKLWRRVRYTKTMPSPEEIERTRSLVGYENLVLDAKEQTARLRKEGMRLDLGGIAKGYAADAALEVLKQQGCPRALIALGGDIVAGDSPPGAEGWKVGIAPLLNPDGEPSRFLSLAHAAVSTSGDAEQYIDIDGKRYSHIVDPRTGIGLVGRVSVTVVAPNGTMSDSLTKLVAVLGPEKGLPIIDSMDGVAALVVRKTDAGEEAFTSKRFRELRLLRSGDSKDRKN
jgi:FAD:protein FMN transferase